MDCKLDHLNLVFREVVFELLARYTEDRLPMMIINTFRTEAEQLEAVRSGHSWVTHSKHQDGRAIDVCPYEVYNLHGDDKLQWDARDPVWERVASIGERLGLRSGYRWMKKDCGHLEML